MEIDRFVDALPDLAERILTDGGVALDRHDGDLLLERTVVGQLVRINALTPTRRQHPPTAFRVTKLGERILQRVQSAQMVQSVLTGLEPHVTLRGLFDELARFCSVEVPSQDDATSA